MSTRRVRVIRRSSSENLGYFVINTFPVDQEGKQVAPTDPTASNWHATWAPTDGTTHQHAPVYSKGMSLNFHSDDDARDGCIKAIQKYFGKGNLQDIEVV
jgi:hypothetical protein